MYENLREVTLRLVLGKGGKLVASRKLILPKGFIPTKIDLQHRDGRIVRFTVFDTLPGENHAVVLEVGNYNQELVFQDMLDCGFEAIDEPKAELVGEGDKVDLAAKFDPTPRSAIIGGAEESPFGDFDEG